jgi:hypothetical protein
MFSLAKPLPSNENAAPSRLKERLFPICFLGTIAVATIGWVWTIGWITLAAAKWLLA